MTVQPHELFLDSASQILQATFGQTNADLMETLKKKMDPKGLLNT